MFSLMSQKDPKCFCFQHTYLEVWVTIVSTILLGIMSFERTDFFYTECGWDQSSHHDPIWSGSSGYAAVVCYAIEPKFKLVRPENSQAALLQSGPPDCQKCWWVKVYILGIIFTI